MSVLFLAMVSLFLSTLTLGRAYQLIWLEKERHFGISISDSGKPNSDFGKWLKVIG
jgi:hypothetical protein